MNLLAEQEIWLNENKLAPKEYKIISPEETESLRISWRGTFITNANFDSLHRCPKCTKLNNQRSYDWHAFSYKKVESKEVNGDYLRNYLNSSLNELYLIWEECKSQGLIISSKIVRKCKWTNTDIYIFDSSLKWTFVVTHEGWLYFIEK